jgi:hypothetical protein
MSEFELYGRWATQRFPARSVVRHLKYNDYCAKDSAAVAYNTCHHHARDRKGWMARMALGGAMCDPRNDGV